MGEDVNTMVPLCVFCLCDCLRSEILFFAVDEISHEHLPFGGVPLPLGGGSSVWKISTLP